MASAGPALDSPGDAASGAAFTAVPPSVTDRQPTRRHDGATEVEALAASTLLEQTATAAEAACELTIVDDAGPTSQISLAELGGTRTAGAAAAIEPTKEGKLKILCPNCQCQGELPWGRMNSLLCCTSCGRWYRIAAAGGLIEAPAPKNFGKGSLRFYRSDGRERIVALTPADLQRQRQRRAWSLSKLWQVRPAGLLTMSKESLAVVVLLGYLVGIFALCYLQYVGPRGSARLPSAPPLLSQ